MSSPTSSRRLTRPLLVTVAVGTMLEPSRSAAQTMVVTIETEIYLDPRESGSRDIPVACARMRKDQPGDGDRFTISGEPATGDLLRLLRASEFAVAGARVQQFAVWTITNDPGRNGYTGLTSTFDPLGSGPSDEDFAAIRALLETAGIRSRRLPRLSLTRETPPPPAC